jgi:hypothetical protein
MLIFSLTFLSYSLDPIADPDRIQILDLGADVTECRPFHKSKPTAQGFKAYLPPSRKKTHVKKAQKLTLSKEEIHVIVLSEAAHKAGIVEEG